VNLGVHLPLMPFGEEPRLELIAGEVMPLMLRT
jgi:hypothetical protein